MMKRKRPITCIFLDIGGVVLNDGWGRSSRQHAAKIFNLNFAEMETRHRLNFETLEDGNMTLREYLSRVVFYQKRKFSHAQFKKFMFSRSKSNPLMLDLVRQLKSKYKLKIIVVSNESRELNAYRLRTFKIGEFVDAFVSSCYVGTRKPDLRIFKLALDLAQVPAEQIVYIENTDLFVQVAAGLGIRGILHQDFKSTRGRLAELGLGLNESLDHEGQ